MPRPLLPIFPPAPAYFTPGMCLHSRFIYVMLVILVFLDHHTCISCVRVSRAFICRLYPVWLWSSGASTTR